MCIDENIDFIGGTSLRLLALELSFQFLYCSQSNHAQLGSILKFKPFISDFDIRTMSITEALRLQMEVQKRLHEQLEVQYCMSVNYSDLQMYTEVLGA